MADQRCYEKPQKQHRKSFLNLNAFFVMLSASTDSEHPSDDDVESDLPKVSKTRKRRINTNHYGEESSKNKRYKQDYFSLHQQDDVSSVPSQDDDIEESRQSSETTTTSTESRPLSNHNRNHVEKQSLSSTAQSQQDHCALSMRADTEEEDIEYDRENQEYLKKKHDENRRLCVSKCVIDLPEKQLPVNSLGAIEEQKNFAGDAEVSSRYIISLAKPFNEHRVNITEKKIQTLFSFSRYHTFLRWFGVY